MKIEGAMEAFQKELDNYPTQDNEGYRPDRAGFKCGWFAAIQWLTRKLEANGDYLYGKSKFEPWHPTMIKDAKLKGLLVNVFEIPECKHPINQIQVFQTNGNAPNFKCTCGAVVMPQSFKEV